MFNIKGKVAFITGGCGGIGFAMVTELLKNDAVGVAIIDVCAETGKKILKEIETSFGLNKAIFIKTDVTNKKELEEAFLTTVTTFGQLDIVINNAGILNEIDWEKTIAVNLTAVIQGSFLAMEKYLPKYKSGEEGIIVNTGSILGLKTIQSIPIYCVSKHGVVSLGEALGGDEYYKKYKVRVLTICPGVVNTPLVSEINFDNIILKEKGKEEIKNCSKIYESPKAVGKTLIKVIKEGKSGSLWVTEDEKSAYQVEKLDYKLMRKN